MSSSLIITILLFLLGLVLIIKGGDWFVDAATWMAAASGLPQFLIGATVVSMATTLPEIIVSTMAAAEGSTDLAIGNAIGSVTANTGLIMAISLIFMPVVIRMSQFSVKGVLMVLSTLVLWLLCRDGLLSLPESLIVLVLFIAFLIENIRSAKKLSQEESSDKAVPVDKSRKALLKNLALFVLGAACLVVGSNLLVDNGTVLAQVLGVSERIIAVTMVAIGTSLPELVTAITAIVKKQSSMSVGNILGANIIDITIILPLCALISGDGLQIAAQSVRQTVYLDMPMCVLETAIGRHSDDALQALYQAAGHHHGGALHCLRVCHRQNLNSRSFSSARRSSVWRLLSSGCKSTCRRSVCSISPVRFPASAGKSFPETARLRRLMHSPLS